MLKFNQLLCCLLLGASVSGCVNTTSEKRWDFDHEVQFSEVEISPNRYQLTVMQTNNAPFETLATFLLRRSLMLCGGYGYKLEIEQGVEGFDDKQGAPNLILSDLSAKLECPTP